VKAHVRARLAACPVPVYLFMPVQNGMGEPSLDFIGCIGGWFFAVETKAGHEIFTPRQQHTAMRMEAAGAAVFLVNEDPATWIVFEDWLIRAAAMAALEQGEQPVPEVPEWAARILNEGVENGSCR
jgi:hypothetical protein